jgi:beta-galactosidase
VSGNEGRDGRPRWPARPAGIAYGGDYNPDQWPEEVWREDVTLMRQAGVNLVSVGVFSWSRLQPAPDRWDLGWLHRLLDLLYENGIAVDLATATASPPPWFIHAHRDALPVTSSGVRLEIGSRQHVCPSSPAFRDAAAVLLERLAVEFGDHPAVVMWHIGNEYGDHVRECFCDVSAAAFRSWLRDRYSTIEALNEAWTTAVWSGRFGGWDEVMPPRDAPGPRNPGQVLDWRRFSSDALLACFETERSILTRLTPDLPVTTNFMRLNDGIDHHRWAAREDIVSADLYPDPADPASEAEAALSHHLMRSLGGGPSGGRPWLLLEQARSAVDWRPVNLPKRPGLMRALSLAAVGRGADGIMFFQWRGARGGAEAFHSTMLPAGGTATRGWRDTVSLGAALGRLAEVAGSTVACDTALLLDWEAWWALELLGHPTEALCFADQVYRWHAPLHERNIALDVREPSDDLAGYRLAVAPNLFLLDAGAATALERWVEAGGVLVVGAMSGVVDPSYHVPSGPYPAVLRDLLGIRWEEVWPVAEGSVGVAFDDGSTARATVQRDALDLDAAEAVARYSDGDLAGWPAVTRRALGRGEVWYAGCVLDPAGTAWIVDAARRRAGVSPPLEVPAGVRVARRDSAGSAFLFCVNHGASPASVTVPADGTELLKGHEVRAGDRLMIAPLDAVVLRLPGTRRGSPQP